MSHSVKRAIVITDMENRRGASKFNCYFCNKTIENETEMGHTAVCVNVLVPCPNKCGAYIPRIDLKKHNRECINRTTKSSSRLPTLNENSTYDNYDKPISRSLDRNINGYTKNDVKIHEEITKLSRRFAEVERRFGQQNAYLPSLSQNCDILKNNQAQQNIDIEKLKYHYKTLYEWKKNLEIQVTSLKQSASVLQNSKKEIDMHFMALQDRIILLEKLQMDVDYLRDSFIKEQTYTRQVNLNFEQDFKDFKGLFAQENATSGAMFQEHKIFMDTLRLTIEDIRKTVDEQKAKLTNVVFDLRAASQIASEAAEKIEIHERDYTETKKEINQIRLDLEILEGLSSSNDPNITPGRLIWKISDVDTKKLRAKEFNSVLKSPVFYTHEYGYKIRVLMYLNGIKKWKDRYALLCIHVLKGEYDMLLRWPCHIEGNITLRDLEDQDKGKSVTKFITAKRQCGDEESEEPQESSSSYIFIPHATLYKSNYIKQDTMFIDIKIQKNSKLETSL